MYFARQKSIFPKALLVAFALVGSIGNAYANSLSYVAPTKEAAGKFSGDLPIASIGTVRTPKGLVRFRDDELQVLAVPQWLFDRNVVLKGAIVETEVFDSKTLQGLVYFLDGEWLDAVAKTTAEDEIDLGNARVRGKILSRDGRSFVMQHHDGSQEKIAFRDIKTIVSPRAFTFTVPLDSAKVAADGQALAFESNTVSLTPTKASHNLLASRNVVVPKSKLPGTEPGISKKALVTYLALDVAIGLAPAVAIPLTLNHSTQKAALNAVSRYDAQHGLYDGPH